MKNLKSQASSKKRMYMSLLCFSAISLMIACSGGENKDNSSTGSSGTATTAATDAGSGNIADSLTDKGVGPVTSLQLGAVNSDSAAKGETLFKTKCAACHKLDARLVGPALKGVTKRRTPEWIMNQILNPAEQDNKDALGKALLAKYMTQMTFQNVSQAEARDILEFFRSTDSAN